MVKLSTGNIVENTNMKQEITFHVNHYEEDEHIYVPIINKLISEGWHIDEERSKTEIIGVHTFKFVWLKRVFES